MLYGYTNEFKSFSKKEKLSGVPKRLFIEPGLIGKYDELHIWGDTLLVYSSTTTEPLNTAATLALVALLDRRLQNILGTEFTGYSSMLLFVKESETPLEYKSKTVNVFVRVGKWGDKGFMTTPAFSGTTSKLRRL